VAFKAIDWTAGAHPLEIKKVDLRRPAALLELGPGFEDPNPCLRSHVIYVLQGVLRLELEDRVEQVEAGECCWLDAGTAHRACNGGAEPLLLFVASDLEAAR
jgi:hypothetical protein